MVVCQCMPVRARHKILGECLVTQQCRYMQTANPDPLSMYIEHDGEIKEVTTALVEIVK